MRILLCNYEYPPLGGGGGVVSALLAEELAKRHEVTVLTSHGSDLPARSVERGVRVYRAPVYFRAQKSVASFLSMLAYFPNAIRTGKELLGVNRYDVINTHFVVPTGPVGDTLARWGGIPNVLSLHGGDLFDPSKLTSPHRNPLLRIAIRGLLRRADLVVGQSSNTLANMRRYYTPEVAGRCIPLGIQRPAAGTAERGRYGFQEDDILLVTVGRLVARKAVHQLIAMMDTFKSDRVRLLVIGSGPQERALKEHSAGRLLGQQVRFLGEIEESEKFRILKMCDIYVSTSQHEGFGLAFLEAMASGLPIVCYDHGGQTDFLRDEQTGYLVKLNDQDAFRETCKLLIGDPELRRVFGEDNRRRVEEFYIERHAAAYESVFSEVIEAKSAEQNARDERHWAAGKRA